MDANQLVSLLTTATQPAIFAGLFVWLFTKDRSDAREREIWFRVILEGFGKSLDRMNDQLTASAQAMAQVAQQLSRIESNQRRDT